MTTRQVLPQNISEAEFQTAIMDMAAWYLSLIHI